MRFVVETFMEDYPREMSEEYSISLRRWLDNEDSKLDRARVFFLLSLAYAELGGLPPVVDEVFEEFKREFE
jgi:hypothetical protein